MLVSTSAASMPNFSRSSRCHCSASAGEHSTASRWALPWASSSAAMSPASMVLPMPTRRRSGVGRCPAGAPSAAGRTGTARADAEPSKRTERAGGRRETDPQRGAQQVGGGSVSEVVEAGRRESGRRRHPRRERHRRCRRGRRRAAAAAGSPACVPGSTTHSRPRARTSVPGSVMLGDSRRCHGAASVRDRTASRARCTTACQSSS